MTLATDQNSDDDKLSPTARRFLALRKSVLAEWERKVRNEFSEAEELQHPVLINTMPSFFDNLAQAISPAYPRATASSASSIAAEHGGQRARLTQYKVELVIREYQLLRSALLDEIARQGLVLSAEELAAINASLDQAIREASAAFTLASAALREQLAAALTHDLRTPLNVATLSAELMLRITDVAKIHELATDILRTHRRMDEMIQRLLDAMLFDSASKPSLNLSNFDIRELVGEVQADAAVTGARIVTAGDSLMGWWDRDSLKRALENLVGNAVKYGEAGGVITIKIAEAHQQLFLSVHNEGPPISAEDQDLIFQPFLRLAGARLGRHSGWGVGLGCVRTVAESHGGSVVVDSSAERGTTFLLDMPVDARPFQERPVLG